ncbi:MAG: hypothetical protein HQK54_16820, partial [Oligoflexales bacterium]|nr:hypothetical protein [Oligoflexales bacterium]
MFFDDLQWADSFCLKLTKTFASRSRQMNLGHSLFLGAFRNDEGENVNEIIVPELETRQYLALERLGEYDSARLVELLLDESGDEIAKLASLTYNITSGNPFFIYEFLNAALKNGLFKLNVEEKWILDENPDAIEGISESVADLVTSRIKKISKNAYDALCTASVVGNNIRIEFLRELLLKRQQKEDMGRVDSKDSTYLGSAIHELQLHHLIWPSEEKIVFFHDRIRSSSYATLSEDQRKFIHREYFRILDREYFKSNEKIDPKILFETAFHIQKSLPNDDTERSKSILKLAGERALSLFSYVRAREYFKDCSKLYPKDFMEIMNSDLLDEYCLVQECLADALSLSEAIEQAIIIYDFILLHIQIPQRRASVYLKLCNNHFYMYQYEDAIKSANFGLKELKVKIMTSEIFSLIYIIVSLPFMLLFLLWFRFFGSQRKVINDDREELLWNLRIAVQIPTYFTKPYLVLAQHISYTFELLFYKDNRYRAMAIVYWGVFTAVLGLDRISQICYKKGLHYFKNNYDPVQYAFTLFTMAYLLDFPQGRIKVADSKIQEVIRICTGVGETFIRLLCYQAMIQNDLYGGDTGNAESATKEDLKLWHKIGLVRAVMGYRIRFLIMKNEIAEADKWIKMTIEAGKKTLDEGFQTIDSSYSLLEIGEANILLDEPYKAISFLKKGLKSIILHFHRVAYCNYAPILLSQAYTRSNQPVKGLFALAFTILNFLFSVKIFLPQTRFAFGEALFRIGFKRWGRRVM